MVATDMDDVTERQRNVRLLPRTAEKMKADGGKGEGAWEDSRPAAGSGGLRGTLGTAAPVTPAQ